MQVIGITGGIGSGKTTVTRVFELLNVPVYIADKRAKELMNSDLSLQQEIIDLLGPDSYLNGVPDRKYIAKRCFSNPSLLNQLNEIIHPRVSADFISWCKSKKEFKYVLKEAAILFESGSYKSCDKVILVTAPLEQRISRVMQRDEVSRKDVLARIENQWTDDKKSALADYKIPNDNQSSVIQRVMQIHKDLMNEDIK